MIFLKEVGTELYIGRVGRFNADAYYGWGELEAMIGLASQIYIPNFSHEQVQTLLGAIGAAKGYDIWIPPNDRVKLDWSLASRFECRSVLPYGMERVSSILEEVDVIWIPRGSSTLNALFEIEHSTPIYSGLLRFNDIHLVSPNLHPRFTVVANDARRSLFVRQLNRPTFQMSGLGELCTFLNYANVFGWYNRTKTQ